MLRALSQPALHLTSSCSAEMCCSEDCNPWSRRGRTMGAEFKMPSAADNPKMSKDQKMHSHAWSGSEYRYAWFHAQNPTFVNFCFFSPLNFFCSFFLFSFLSFSAVERFPSGVGQNTDLHSPFAAENSTTVNYCFFFLLYPPHPPTPTPI